MKQKCVRPAIRSFPVSRSFATMLQEKRDDTKVQKMKQVRLPAYVAGSYPHPLWSLGVEGQ
jgi:hypothetical protein